MNIIFANKYNFLKGGAERYMFDLRDLLVRHGHAVIPFAMKDGRNQSTHWSDKFVSPVQTERVSFSWQGLRTAGRALYSFEAKRKFASLLDEVKPDVVHLHNIYHQISPSILPEAKRRGIPVVLTAHDYHLIAPSHSLFHDGHICTHTQPNHYFNAVEYRCVKGSRAASLLEATAMHLHRLLGLWRDNIDLVIAPSAFVAGLLEEYGWDGNKIVQVPHFINAHDWVPRYEGGEYALYIGRLSAEKGVETLIRAATLAKDVPVHIVGIGPEDRRLHRVAEQIGADNVVFKGYLSGEALHQEITRAKFVVAPSVCYEVFGLSVLEAYASGKPVIASQMGGLGEIVRDGETGLLFSAGDVEDLADRLDVLWRSPDLVRTMGRRARRMVEAEYGAPEHYHRIMSVYESVRPKK
ncbi:MAG: glycosyltransferase family 4 protein [Patescibacteria group bacterium]